MLNLEKLESREVMATVNLTNGVLSVIAQPSGSVIQVTSDGTNIRVLADNKVSLFPVADVVSLSLVGSKTAFNDITNLTSLNSVIVGGDKGNMLQAFGGNDTILCGAGADTVYDILGTNRVVSVGTVTKDTLFVNAASVTLAKGGDQVVRFFDVGRTPGAGSVQLVNGVVYITPSNGGTSAVVSQLGGKTTVQTSFAGTFTFNSKVNYIGYFGGGGDDFYLNNSTIPEVAYGGIGGNDVMVGNLGTFSFMKGGGGNDTIIGRADRNDLAGNGGVDVLFSLRGVSVFRLDAMDAFNSRKRGDQVVL